MRRLIPAVALLCALTAVMPAAAAPRSAPRAAVCSDTAPACTGITPTAQIGTPVRILALGDSRTATGEWQAELDRLLTSVGVVHTITTVGVGGTRCDYWPSRIAGLLDQYQPTVLMLACGTNDDPNATVYGEPTTSWSWRYTVEAAHSRGVAVIPALVQYSDPILAPDRLLTNEPQTNDHLYVEIQRHRDWWPGGVADLQWIPATATYLAADPYPAPPGSIGIHPTPRGYRYMGRIEFDAGARNGLWPATLEPPLCDLYGHRKGYPRPSFIPCDC